MKPITISEVEAAKKSSAMYEDSRHVAAITCVSWVTKVDIVSERCDYLEHSDGINGTPRLLLQTREGARSSTIIPYDYLRKSEYGSTVLFERHHLY